MTRLLRWAVTAAAIAIASRWEVGYGEQLQLGPLAWAMPLLTSGYLWLAMERGRDVAAAVAALTVSILIGALGTVITIPSVILAGWTALLVASVLYRTHRIGTPGPAVDQAGDVDEDQDDDLEHEQPSSARVLPLVGEPGPVVDDERLLAAFASRYTAGAPMSVDEVHRIRRQTRDADRAWHRRALQRARAGVAA